MFYHDKIYIINKEAVMNAKWLKIVNPVLFILIVVQMGTGMTLRFAPNHFIFEIHENAGIFLLLVLIAHVYLNYGWIKANFFKK